MSDTDAEVPLPDLNAADTLSIDDACAKAREILREYPAGGYMTIIEGWCQLPDGQIQFTMRRLPTADQSRAKTCFKQNR